MLVVALRELGSDELPDSLPRGATSLVEGKECRLDHLGVAVLIFGCLIAHLI